MFSEEEDGALMRGIDPLCGSPRPWSSSVGEEFGEAPEIADLTRRTAVSGGSGRIQNDADSEATAALCTMFSKGFGIVGVVLLGIVAAVTAAAPVTSSPSRCVSVYVLATVAMVVASMLSSTSGALDWVVSLFFAIFIAIPAFVQIRAASFPFGGSYDNSQLNTGILIFSLGQMFLIAGTRLRHHIRSNKVPTEKLTGRKHGVLSPRDTLLTGRIACLTAIIGAALAAASGPAAVFTARSDAMDQTVDTGGQVLAVGRCFSVVALLMSVILVKYRRKGVGAASAWAVCIPVAVSALIVNFPPALPRFQLLGLILAAVALVFDFTRPRVKLIFTAVSTFFILYLFPAVKDLRGTSLADNFSKQAFADRSPSQYLLSVDFDGYKQTVDTLIYYQQSGLRLGQNFLGVLLFWLPRSLWPGKPVHTGQIVSTGLGYVYNNVSNPLPAEAYASFRVLGVLAVMFTTGILIAAIDTAAAPQEKINVPWILMYGLATGYATILLRGALNAVAPMICPAFVVAMAVFIRYRWGEPQTRNTVDRQLAKGLGSEWTRPERSAGAVTTTTDRYRW